MPPLQFSTSEGQKRSSMDCSQWMHPFFGISQNNAINMQTIGQNVHQPNIHHTTPAMHTMVHNVTTDIHSSLLQTLPPSLTPLMIPPAVSHVPQTASTVSSTSVVSMERLHMQMSYSQS